MTNSQKANILIAIAVIGFVGLLWTIAVNILDKYFLSKDYRYSITKKISYGGTSKTGTSLKYIFFVKSKTYSGFTSSNMNSDSSYFIKYYPDDPCINEATLIIANKSDIKNLPVDGYKQIPHK